MMCCVAVFHAISWIPRDTNCIYIMGTLGLVAQEARVDRGYQGRVTLVRTERALTICGSSAGLVLSQMHQGCLKRARLMFASGMHLMYDCSKQRLVCFISDASNFK